MLHGIICFEYNLQVAYFFQHHACKFSNRDLHVHSTEALHLLVKIQFLKGQKVLSLIMNSHQTKEALLSDQS